MNINKNNSTFSRRACRQNNHYNGNGCGKKLLFILVSSCIGLATLYFRSCLKKSITDNEAKNHMNAYNNKADVDVEKQEKMKNIAIEKQKAMNELAIDKHRQMHEIDKEYESKKKKENSEIQIPLNEWQDKFNLKFPMPEYTMIPHINTILDGSPETYRPAMLLHMLSMYGALCFSKVRAKYLDDNYHSPSLQVVIEGAQCSSKGRFNDVFKMLFSRIIKNDSEKLKTESATNIVQTTGIDISRQRFQEMLAYNRGDHIYMMETEIDVVTESFKKSGGLSTALLRKAFSNEAITQDNKKINVQARGSYSVYFNYTFMGTPKAVDRLFKDKDYEDGTASRVCFAVIPEVFGQMPDFKMPRKDKLSTMQDQIDAWRKKYCYTTDENGADIPAEETVIDLSYVDEELKRWLDAICKCNDKARMGISARIACIAFHCAIVLHMTAGCPGVKEWKKRKQIKDLTLYLADYCMERYLYKSSPDKAQRIEELSRIVRPVYSNQKRELTDEEIKYWYYKRGKTDEEGNIIGYGTIAKHLNMDKDKVRNLLKKYGKSLN